MNSKTLTWPEWSLRPFPFRECTAIAQMYALDDHPQFQKLNEQQRAIAVTVDANSALALLESGHWVSCH